MNPDDVEILLDRLVGALKESRKNVTAITVALSLALVLNIVHCLFLGAQIRDLQKQVQTLTHPDK